MKKSRMSLQGKFLLTIAVIIFPILGLIFTWIGIQQEKQVMAQITDQARVIAKQIILIRHWVSDCGGVMVLRESKGAKGTVCFYDDRMETPRGCFQRFTPSMVTMKLSQYSLRQDLYRFRLASLTPLNPKNRADDFEEEALHKFQDENLNESYRVIGHGRNATFQYMVPLRVNKTCIGCHKDQGFAKGDVRGGLSVILPIGKIKSSLRKDHLRLAASGVGLIVLTIAILFILLRREIITPMKELERMTVEIGKGNLDARVNISTGDEFEKLGKAFNSMASRLSQGRDLLDERIRQATKELADANKELQTLDKLKSDFLANMSHELRSPLTVIRGGVDYLNRTIKGPENRRYLAIIDKNLNRLIRLVSDLFDFTKIEANKANWFFEEEDLAGLVQEVIEIIMPLATAKGMIIIYRYPGNISVKMDLERIEQVLVNLIDNAIKFSDKGTEIRIEVKEEKEDILVAVKDRGRGISEENLEIIFEKFHTVPSSGGRGKREGTGLGLAICKGIIEAHGGRIWAESVEGEGSTFYFSIPKHR